MSINIPYVFAGRHFSYRRMQFSFFVIGACYDRGSTFGPKRFLNDGAP